MGVSMHDFMNCGVMGNAHELMRMLTANGKAVNWRLRRHSLVLVATDTKRMPRYCFMQRNRERKILIS
jgi:hypothetical protein